MNPGFDITLFNITFVLYFAGFVAFALSAGLRTPVLPKIGALLMAAGLVPHTAAFFVRWKLASHIPLSNMYEYLSLMGWAAVVTMLVVFYRFRRPVIGSLVSPLVFMLMVAAALLPKDINQSLMPALQSFWLQIHVSLAAIGSGCFLIAFGASLIYLLRGYDLQPSGKVHLSRNRNNALIFLIALPIALSIAEFILGIRPTAPYSRLGSAAGGFNFGSGFILLGLNSIACYILAGILWPGRRSGDRSGFGGWLFAAVSVSLLIGALATGFLMKTDFLVLTQQLPSQQGSVKSGWLIFEFLGASYLLAVILSPLIINLLMRTTVALRSSEALKQDVLDEMSYKTVSVGYPLYTVGALFAGAIWAEQAWGAFWSWDPKEVGALIIWLFYSGYLHARLQHGWSGSRAAMLVVAGFLMVLLSFFGNYFFGGLHAYA